MPTTKKQVDTYMTEDQIKRLDKIANKQLISRSALIRKTLVEVHVLV